LIVYKDFWNAREMRPGSPLVTALHREPSLFRFRAAPIEAPVHAGPLSLKSVRAGQTAYIFGSREFQVNPGQVLVVPPQLRYSTRVERGADIASFYFPASLATEALNVLLQPVDRLLDGSTLDPGASMDFPPHRRDVHPTMWAALDNLEQCPSASLTDIGLLALEMAARFCLEAKNAIGRLPAAKLSVRRELFRRACAARDEITANPQSELRLDALARASSLSPFHLHRVFRAAFGETPALMQRRLRVERAQHLLAQPAACIGEIAHRVGFRNESAFSRSFRMLTGMSPRSYRLAR
jgi:AraC-like DNA-binding protein